MYIEGEQFKIVMKVYSSSGQEYKAINPISPSLRTPSTVPMESYVPETTLAYPTEMLGSGSCLAYI